MYYHGFSTANVSGSKFWTVYDDQLITLLFSKIITKTSQAKPGGEDLTSDIVNNLFDLCFYINNDYHVC